MTHSTPNVNTQNGQFNSTNGNTRTAEQQAKLDEFNRKLEENYFNPNDERDLMDQMIDPDGGVRVTPEDLIPRRFAGGFSYGSNGNGNGNGTHSSKPNDTGDDDGKSKRKAKTVKEFSGAAALRYCDAGHANAFYQLSGQRYAYTLAAGWRTWTGTHWTMDKAESTLWADIRAFLVATMNERVSAYDVENAKKSMPTGALITGVMNHLRHDCMSLESEFAPAAHLLNCANGVVDLRTGQLLEHDPEYGFTYCIETAYVPGARSAVWEKQLESMFPFMAGTFTEDWMEHDRNPVIPYLQKCLGYSITGETKEELAFYMYGETRSGKGTVLNTIAAIIGKGMSTAISFSDLEDSRSDPQNFRLVDLVDARFVLGSESSHSGKLDEALVKRLTGGDNIKLARKGKDTFNFTPKCKLWLMSNFNVNGRFDDDAFWGRWRLFTITGESYLGRENTDLKATLLQQDNREGILSWLVDGAIAYYLDGLKDTPDVMRHDLKRQRDSKDTLGAWINDCVNKSETLDSHIDAIFENYNQWCDDNGIEHRQTKVKLGLALGKRGYKNSTERHSYNDEGKRKQSVKWYVKLQD